MHLYLVVICLGKTQSSWCQRASTTWNFENRHYWSFSAIPYQSWKKSPNVIDDEYKLIRIINDARTMRYVSRIHNMDWSFLDSFGQCQSYFSNFLRVFKKIYEESFPLTRVKIRYRNRLPWLSDGLKASIKHKNKLYLISLKHPTLYNISKYKQYKNKLISLLKIEEKHFYQSQIVQNKNNLRKVWTIVKEVINKKSSTNKLSYSSSSSKF